MALVLSVESGAGQAVPENLIRAELLPGWKTDAGTQMAALRISLAPGWKTYWRAPGEAGIPPRFDWTASGNLAGVAYHWPAPEVFYVNGLRTIAYKDKLVLPIEFLPRTPDKAVDVVGTVDLGVCKDVCVPVEVEVSGALGKESGADPAVRTALASGPRSGAAAGIATPHCVADPIKDGMRLTTDIALGSAREGDFAVVETADSSIWVTNVQSRAGNGHLVDVSELVPSDAQPFALDRSQITITVFASDGTVTEIEGCKG